ncbi:RDD family protein [Gryllotalpicola protaetiae]|uniref:RDD family protein n=1 Tax=Gryllotalpicola protaetiae TaxID=2419771 RepID=A0A387BTD1_9MICO|nr:RDD family protein [Gryllotalpicola protaetiae]AYG04296.1 RDD family protein [Gryllotalpicola protaetiae]
MAQDAPTVIPLAAGRRADEASDAVVTGEAVALAVRPAGFLWRALSGVIDLACSVAVLIGLIVIITSFGDRLDNAVQNALSVVAVVLAFLAYPIVWEVASHGRSVGRFAVGARIVRDDGGAAGTRHAFVRALSGVVEIYATLGGLAVIVALLNGRSKRIGDLLAGTYAQYERVPALTPSLLAMPPQLAAWAQVADVAALPDPLARRVSALLAQQARLSPQARAGLSAELAREVAPFVHPLPAVDAVTFLWAVSAARRAREVRTLDGEARRLAALTPTLARRPNAFPDR